MTLAPFTPRPAFVAGDVYQEAAVGCAHVLETLAPQVFFNLLPHLFRRVAAQRGKQPDSNEVGALEANPVFRRVRLGGNNCGRLLPRHGVDCLRCDAGSLRLATGGLPLASGAL